LAARNAKGKQRGAESSGACKKQPRERRRVGLRYRGRAESYEQPDFVATRILWLDPIEGNARGEAESDTKAETKVEQAKRFLEGALANGEKRQPVIEERPRPEAFLRTL
jgi:hypothetical protein